MADIATNTKTNGSRSMPITEINFALAIGLMMSSVKTIKKILN
jgi:hypothetical protein